MKTLYLISYDNGESYEDHRVYPELIVDSEARAKEVIAECEAWVQEQRDKRPVPSAYSLSTENMSEAEYEAAYEKASDAEQAFYASSSPPYDLNCLIRMLQTESEYSDGGSLKVSAIPFAP